MTNFNDLLGDSLPYTDITLIQLIMALIILAVGLLLVKLFVKLTHKGMVKAKLPLMIVDFTTSMLGVLLKLAVILTFVGALGFDMGPAVLGLSAALGLILAFGMKDTLTNIAAGAWIAALRPFGQGEMVTLAGHRGKVKGLGIMATELLTPDNIRITIPNSKVWGQSIFNETCMKTRRVNVDVGVAYDSDIEKALRIAYEVMAADERILEEPATDVQLQALADSSVNFQLRAWVKTEDYWDVDDDLMKGILKAYNDQDIEIPFPQRVIHKAKE